MRDVVPTPVQVAILTVSDTRTLANDTSGQTALELLQAAGHQVVARVIVKDDESAIRGQVGEWLGAPEIDVIIVTGGTGITTRDVTPEAIAPLISKAIPGFGELFRYLSLAEIGIATIQSRAFAALCDQVLVFALPGSTGAVRLALEKIILPQLDVRTKPCNFVELLPRIRGARV